MSKKHLGHNLMCHRVHNSRNVGTITAVRPSLSEVFWGRFLLHYFLLTKRTKVLRFFLCRWNWEWSLLNHLLQSKEV